MDRSGAVKFTFEELQRTVAPIAKKHGILRVYLFGSRACGDNREDSDYDFCILAPDGYGLFAIGSFLSDLEDALGGDVDIVSETPNIRASTSKRRCFVREESCSKRDAENLKVIVKFYEDIVFLVKLHGSDENDFHDNISLQYSCVFSIIQI